MNITAFLEASLVIQLHTLAAVLAFILGGVVLFRRKGDWLHRLGGRIWVLLMLTVIVTSFFIHSIQLLGLWSPIHLLSIVSLVALFTGVQAARTRKIILHQRTMQSTYFFALLIAGFFTFLPGRLMYQVFFEGSSAIAGGAILATIIAPVLWMVWRSWRAAFL